MTFAARFYCHSGRATPSRRVSKIAKPRIQHNPAGIHLKSAVRCPNNWCQFYQPKAGIQRLPVLAETLYCIGIALRHLAHTHEDQHEGQHDQRNDRKKN
jgi:hypothetical protein